MLSKRFIWISFIILNFRFFMRDGLFSLTWSWVQTQQPVVVFVLKQVEEGDSVYRHPNLTLKQDVRVQIHTGQ